MATTTMQTLSLMLLFVIARATLFLDDGMDVGSDQIVTVVKETASLGDSSSGEQPVVSGAPGGPADGTIDIASLLPDSMQNTLGGLFEKYGHPEDADPGMNAIVHGLLGHNKKFNPDNDIEFNPDDPADEAMSQPSPGVNLAKLEAMKKAAEARADQAAKDREAAEREGQETEAKIEADRKATKENILQSEKRDKQMREKEHSEHEAMMQKNAASRAASQARLTANREKQAKMGARMEEMLRQVHTKLKEDTDGFKNTPFYDEFFENTTTAQRLSLLNFEHLRPFFQELRPEHRVLVLEPSTSLGLAVPFAKSIQKSGIPGAVGRSYHDVSQDSARQDSPYDFVLELGLLDTLAMAGHRQESASRIPELQNAAQRFSGIMKPGGSWLSISVVPPVLRNPLLEKLTSGSFAVPTSSGADAGATAIVMRTTQESQQGDAAEGSGPRFRGSAPAQRLANILLYGDSDSRAFVYHLRRHEASFMPSFFGSGVLATLERLIASQRPSRPDEL